MRTVQIFINDREYKTVTVESDYAGGYNPGIILTMLNDEIEQGLLDQYKTPDGKLVVKMMLSYS